MRSFEWNGSLVAIKNELKDSFNTQKKWLSEFEERMELSRNAALNTQFGKFKYELALVKSEIDELEDRIN